MQENQQAGWHGSIKEFFEADKRIVRSALESFIEDAGSSQIRAWRDSIPMIQRVLRSMKDLKQGLVSLSTMEHFSSMFYLWRGDVART